ncbi:hypothetical protein ACWD26_32720 [Streptomyces sp. NPDC002787]
MTSDDLPGWLVGWCVDQLGNEPVSVLFGRRSLSAVFGLRLVGGRDVVVKAREGDGGADCLWPRRPAVRRSQLALEVAQQIAALLQAPLLRSAKVRAAVTRLSERLPGSGREPDSDGRSLVIAVARDTSGRPLASTALTGPDPYEMTGALLAWGAVHAAAPDAVLKPGARGPVAAFGLETLTLGAAEAGVHEVAEASARPR